MKELPPVLSCGGLKDTNAVFLSDHHLVNVTCFGVLLGSLSAVGSARSCAYTQVYLHEGGTPWTTHRVEEKCKPRHSQHYSILNEPTELGKYDSTYKCMSIKKKKQYMTWLFLYLSQEGIALFYLGCF